MPSSAVRTFSDPDQYAASIRQGTVDLTITERGQFKAKLVRIDLCHLWMQRLRLNLSQISQVDGWGGRSILVFRTQPRPSLSWGAMALRPTEMLRLSAGQSFYQRSSGAASFAGMSVPLEEMAALGTMLGGCDPAPPRDHLAVTPSTDAMAKLQRLHAAIGCLAEEAPEIIANPDAAYGLEQALLEAMVGCLGSSEVGEDRVAQRQHELIMRRFRRVVEENPDQPLYIPELCKAIGVSERTLRVCCQEQLGVGPKRYLLFRRLHLARRALRKGLPDTTTVTEIATRSGFWHFGRFAGEYQSLFGELPSVTLLRQSE
jgi:AraC family ethanolamine operon transcriptional activator